jgi:hypothetical protein
MEWADLLLPFAEAANIRARDVAGTVRKRIVVALPFADTVRLHAELFPGDQIDWPRTQTYLAETSCSPAEWVQLLGLLTFRNEPPTTPMLTELLTSAAAGLRVSTHGKQLSPVETMRLCFARGGPPVSWDILAKSLILTNLIDVDASVALELLLQGDAKRVEAVLKQLATHKHSRDEYTRVFQQLLSHESCHVASHVVLRSIQAREEQQAKLRQGALAVVHGMQKPSLTRLLDQIQEANAAQAPNAESTFRRFCHDARLSANISLRVLRTYYYFACLGPEHASTRTLAYRRMNEDPVVLQALSRAAVIATPETSVLRAFLTHTQHFGAVCPTLRLFRQGHVTPHDCSWTTVLRLYLASYCRAQREMWHFVITSLPPPQQHAFLHAASGAQGEPTFSTPDPQTLGPFAVEELVPMLFQPD